MKILNVLKNIGDEIKFKHKFRGDDNYTIITGKIIEINKNTVDCLVETEFGEFYIGEWLIIV